MDRQQTQQCSTTLASQISISQQVNITLQMPGFRFAMHSSSPNGVCVTTLRNGAAHNSGETYFDSVSFYYLMFEYRPANADELFNLRHASARNVIERIFGVLKPRFRILVYAAEIDMDLQARIPAALTAIHNFIRIHDPEELTSFTEPVDLERGFVSGELAAGQTRTAHNRQ